MGRRRRGRGRHRDALDTLDISNDAVRFRVRTRLDEYIRKWSSAHVRFDASGRWGRRFRIAAGPAGRAGARARRRDAWRITYA
ncbi:hypothetical protein AB0L65_29050 [Nonomuraea sp. NPDC052116]|uniref:hypothetical protein n=1 Tax=Nonomuraea sp. NPDC052116 TaxID=3155665 RepID=UPI003445C61D